MYWPNDWRLGRHENRMAEVNIIHRKQFLISALRASVGKLPFLTTLPLGHDFKVASIYEFKTLENCLVTCQGITSKNTQPRWVYSWVCDTVMWYWLAATLFWQLSIDPCMCNIIFKASHWLESERFQPKFLGRIQGKRIFVAMGLRGDLWAEGQ